jgi:hypothetical protein
MPFARPIPAGDGHCDARTPGDLRPTSAAAHLFVIDLRLQTNQAEKGKVIAHKLIAAVGR